MHNICLLKLCLFVNHNKNVPVNFSLRPAISLALVRYSSVPWTLPYTKYACAISRHSRICSRGLSSRPASSLDSFAVNTSISEYKEALVSSNALWWITLHRNNHHKWSCKGISRILYDYGQEKVVILNIYVSIIQ